MSEDKQVEEQIPAHASDGSLSDENMESVSGGLSISGSSTIYIPLPIPTRPPPTFPTEPILLGSEVS
jgi:hypothetical protein